MAVKSVSHIMADCVDGNFFLILLKDYGYLRHASTCIISILCVLTQPETERIVKLLNQVSVFLNIYFAQKPYINMI